MTTLLLIIIYGAFISLGLPDALLGVSWPIMQNNFLVPSAFAGFIAMRISVGTIISSLFSGRILKRFGTGKVTAFSVILTALALWGFSISSSFYYLILLAIPLGLGCAPIYPCMLHETPLRFGTENSQFIMGFQMATAYIGATFLPPIFGLIASVSTFYLFPIFILVYIFAMLVSSEKVNLFMKNKSTM